jgi:hypothetical protein
LSILALVIILVLLGLLCWGVNAIFPLPAWMKTLINVVIAVVAILIVLNAFGLLDIIRDIRVPRVN